MALHEISTSILEARDLTADLNSLTARIEAFRNSNPDQGPPLIIPPSGRIDGVSQGTIPEIPAENFTPNILRSAVADHGALIVRNMFPRVVTDTLTEVIDRVLETCSSAASDKNIWPEPSAYANPPPILKSVMPGPELGYSRGFHRDSGSAMCVESPTVAEALLQLFEDYGLKDVITDYLGEPPCVTAKKWVLRRSKLPISEAGWHQDGAFMGTDINSINMWVPLTHCGGNSGAPGMDIIPKRLYNVASAEGAFFEWSVSPSQVDGRFTDTPPISPVFNAGDAFFFDHLYLHRTQFGEEFTRQRYAIETWFFGLSRFPKNQVPLAW